MKNRGDLPQLLKERLRGPVRKILEITGVPAGVRQHFQDRLLKSTLARFRSIPRGGRMWSGSEILWPRPGMATLGNLDVPSPGPGEVLVKSEYSAVSPGTERAFFNVQAGVTATFPIRPGYSTSGVVLAVGRGVETVGVGQRVACTETPHASLALVPSQRTFSLPESVSMEDAAFLQLLIIAQQGIRKARIARGESVAIVGAGLVGQLALQIARAWGSGTTTMVAASAAKRELSMQSGADRFVDLAAHDSELDGLDSDVVVEVAGVPSSLPASVRACRRSGRIVLLGSTRGVNTGVDFDLLLRTKELELIGAHISTVGSEHRSDVHVSYAEEAHDAVELLAAGKVTCAHLVSERVDPDEAGLFYRRLSSGEEQIVGALIDWAKLPERHRARRSFVVVRPRDLMKRGRPYDQNDGQPSVMRSEAGKVLGYDAAAEMPARLEGRALRFALVGCGGMGARHAQAIRDATNAELVATMDVDERLARELAGEGFYTTDFKELLARPEVDAVFIATPNHLHEPLAVEAARARKHVIVEKPIAPNLAAADRAVAACREAGVALSVGYSFRYTADTRIARRLVEAGALGRLLTVQYSCYLDKPASYWGSGYTGRTFSSWRGNAEKSGGGVLIMNMSHQLDQIRYVTGQDLRRVTAVSGILDSPRGIEVEDVIAISCEFTSGAIGSMFGTCCARGIDNLLEICLNGDLGSIILGPQARFFSLHHIDGLAAGRWHSFGKLPSVDVQACYVARFATAVLQGREPEISGDDGRAVQAWMEAAYESARVGRPVDVRTAPTR